MTERPILFSSPMVRALLAGTKTVTRRLVNPKRSAPYAVVGDRLWVRETWRAVERESDAVDGVLYAADEMFIRIHNSASAADAWVEAYNNGVYGESWRPSIFMPRWACRLELNVVSVRQERLFAITEADAKLEGVACDRVGPGDTKPSYKASFAYLWREINGDRSFDSNPFVWRVEFERARESVVKA